MSKEIKEIKVVFRGNFWSRSYSDTFPEHMFSYFRDDENVIRILDAETGEEIWWRGNDWNYFGF